MSHRAAGRSEVAALSVIIVLTANVGQTDLDRTILESLARSKSPQVVLL
jgi:hypothetical protein